MKDPKRLLNVSKGTLGNGYPKCEATKICMGEPIQDLKTKYCEESNYRLARHEPNFSKP